MSGHQQISSRRFTIRALQNPSILTASIIGGVLGSTASFLINPILGIIGFGSLGPVAGSLAAAWQSSFVGGLVQAGSVFSWCQSVAMGGAAAAAAAAAAAGGVAAAAGVVVGAVGAAAGVAEGVAEGVAGFGEIVGDVVRNLVEGFLRLFG